MQLNNLYNLCVFFILYYMCIYIYVYIYIHTHFFNKQWNLQISAYESMTNIDLDSPTGFQGQGDTGSSWWT